MQFPKSRIFAGLAGVFLLGIILFSLWKYSPADPVQLINIVILLFLIVAAYIYMRKVPSRTEISSTQTAEKDDAPVLFRTFAYFVCEDKHIGGQLSVAPEYLYFTASEQPFDSVTLTIARADIREITPLPPANLILTDIDDREWEFSSEQIETLAALLTDNLPDHR